MSAKEPGRPIFNQLISQLQTGKAQGIVCWKLDRLSRNPIDSGMLIQLNQKYGVEIITPSQNYSPGDESLILMYVEAGIAHQYVTALSRNVIRGNKTKYEQGWWCGPAPVGYLNKDTRIIKDPDRFDKCRMIWDWALMGQYSVEMLQMKAIEIGLTSKSSKRNKDAIIASSSIHKMLTNPFYSGMMPTKRYGLMPGNHPPMITESEFEKVRLILGGKSHPRLTDVDLPFRSGLMKCGECGCSITGYYCRPRPGVEYVYFACTKKKLEIPCHQKYIRQEELERQISVFLENIQIPESFANWALKEIRKRHNDETLDRQAIVKHHRKESDSAQHDLDELITMRTQKLLTDDEYLRKKNQLLEQQAIHQQYLDDDNHNAKNWLQTAEKAIHFALNIQQAFLEGDSLTKNQIVALVGSNIILKDGKLAMELNKPFSLFAKATEKSEWLRGPGSNRQPTA